MTFEAVCEDSAICILTATAVWFPTHYLLGCPRIALVAAFVVAIYLMPEALICLVETFEPRLRFVCALFPVDVFAHFWGSRRFRGPAKVHGGKPRVAFSIDDVPFLGHKASLFSLGDTLLAAVCVDSQGPIKKASLTLRRSSIF